MPVVDSSAAVPDKTMARAREWEAAASIAIMAAAVLVVPVVPSAADVWATDRSTTTLAAAVDVTSIAIATLAAAVD